MIKKRHYSNAYALVLRSCSQSTDHYFLLMTNLTTGPLPPLPLYPKAQTRLARCDAAVMRNVKDNAV